MDRGGSHHNGLASDAATTGAGTLTICGTRLGAADNSWWELV